MIVRRNENLLYFLQKLDENIFFKDFYIDGCSNYAFNLILKHKDPEIMKRVISNLQSAEIEFRVGSAGGGNQLRQPYIQKHVPYEHYKEFPNTEHIHFYGMYIGNYPDLNYEDIDFIVDKINV